MECLIYALSEGMELVILKRSCLPILNKRRASWDVGLSVPFFCGITPVWNSNAADGDSDRNDSGAEDGNDFV